LVKDKEINYKYRNLKSLRVKIQNTLARKLKPKKENDNEINW